MKYYLIRQLLCLIRNPKFLWDGSLLTRLLRLVTGFKWKDKTEYEIINQFRPSPRWLIDEFMQEYETNRKWIYPKGYFIQPWNKLLYILIRLSRPEVIVETGVREGISTRTILSALHKNDLGTLISYDTDPKVVFKTRDIHSILKERWYLLIKKLPVEPPYKKMDIFLHDSDHSYENMIQEFKSAWCNVRKGGFILADNINFNSAFKTFAKNVSHPFESIYNLGIIRKRY